jgi:SAM-dependent methyltransferase
MKKVIKFLAYQLSGIFPFIYQALPVFESFNFIKGPLFYLKDYILYKTYTKRKSEPFKINVLDTKPFLYDRFGKAGEVSRHYFYQDIWASKKVYESKVIVHHDIGSRLNGFISQCIIFTRVVMLDIRPLDITVDNLEFIQTDATNMRNIKSDSIESLSSLHAVEHFGLGRYGDKVDPLGYLKVIKEINRVTKKGGRVYFSVPIGRQRLEFNAHRVFDPHYIIDLFSDFNIIEFSVIDDKDIFTKNANINKLLNQNYSCGLFYFIKK